MRRESEIFCGLSEADAAPASFFPRLLCCSEVPELFFTTGGLDTGFRLVDGIELCLTSSEILRLFLFFFLLLSVDLKAIFPSDSTSFNVATSFSKLISAECIIDRDEGRFLFFDE